ncbi:MAG: hypothetical protein RSB51_06010 [Clostridia bacterium]
MLSLLKDKIDNADYMKLKKYIDKQKGEFIFIDKKDNLFNFPFVLYIPSIIESNTIIMHGNNMATNEGNIYNIYAAILETSEEVGGFNLTALNQIIYIPVTSNYIHPANNNMHEFFPMQATRNVVFCKDKNNTYYNIFDQVNRQLTYIREYIFENYGVKLNDRIICHGFSSSAKFVLRYATLNAKKVVLLIAGGFGSQAIIPLKVYNDIKLIYPVGVYDVVFDLPSFKSMKQVYFMGENESSSNDTAMNFRHTDENVKNIYVELFGSDIWERFYKIKDIYSKLDIKNAEFIKYEHYGHTYNDEARKYTKELILKFR